MGFGSILNLDIKNVPPKLSYWVISNFDPKHSEIILGSDRRVHVYEDDVRFMFGFPRGQYKIERPALIETSDVVKEWRLRFERPANRIRASDVRTDMLEDVEGGFWFKSQFLVLLSFCLIENFGNNYVPSHMLDCFDDVDIVSDFNWCAHVVKFLIDHTTSWKENIGKYFTGSTLFITLVYICRSSCLGI